MTTENPTFLERMTITIQGIASRVVSRVSDLITRMKAAGVSDDVIRTRITSEAVNGSTLSEMRNFATAQVPGFVGDMAFRFARDTLSDKQRKVDDALKAVRDRRKDAMEKDAESATGATKTRIEEILNAYKKQGIDITAHKEALPEPPPSAKLSDVYLWVAVIDTNTCSVCAGNHGKVKTLQEWSSIGEPRSGACVGESNCRCVLVPEISLTKSEQKEIRDMGPLVVIRKKPLK